MARMNTLCKHSCYKHSLLWRAEAQFYSGGQALVTVKDLRCEIYDW